ncbi:HAMP domain-containing protein [Pseudomonas putida]|nr:HAMP domain-containing protein [Pseudomonas putida]
MNNWLTHLTVAKKLMIGFGLLLLLVILSIGAGWSAISSLSYRMDRMSAVNRLMDDISKMRLDRSAYLQSEGDAQAAKVLQDKIVEVGQHLVELQGFFANAENARRIASLAEYLATYQRGIESLGQAYEQIEQSRAVRRSSGDSALKRLDELDSLAGEQNGLRDQALYKAVNDLQMQFLYARFETRGYTYGGNGKQYAAAAKAVDATLTALQTLGDVLQGSRASLLNELTQSVTAYRASLDTHRAALTRIDTLLKDIQKQGDALLQTSQDLYDQQMQMRQDDTRDAAWTLISCLVLALLLGGLATVLITRQIVPPLREALARVRRIAEGDLSVFPTGSRKDEIGKLQDGLQHMTGSLRQLVGHIGDGATQIASATEELSAITRQTQAGATEQMQETEQVAAAMHEMTTSVQDVARNAVETARSVNQAAQDAVSGGDIVKSAIARIENLSAEVELTSAAVSTLAEESGRIGSMLDVIKAVAEQTNLLALNAAIEAARAGEAGRGFAVVADEVRALAQRTQRSTEDIEQLIAALRAGTLQAVQRMETSRGLTGESVQLARDAGIALENITHSISGIQGMTQQIAAAAEQQGAVAEEINRNVLNVRDITEQAQTASEQTSTASLELAGLGNSLQGQVRRFQL